ncbi:MAG: efflux RND transporter permease subunit [Pseudanabaenaceae cyanobacterium]
MSISGLAIRRHIGTLMLTIAVVVLGVFYVTRLQVDLLPAITYPRIAVQLDAPGVSPEVAINEITRPLEETLSSTEGVNQIFSRTREGRVRVDLFFPTGKDIDQALNDVTASFNRGRSRLPDNIENIRIFKFDPSQLPVYEFGLTSTELSLAELRTFADEELARELGLVAGVAAVDVTGGVREEVAVNLNLNRMQALGISTNEVLNALRNRNQDVAGGRIRGGLSEPLTRTIGQFRNAQEIADLSFLVAGRRIYLREIAEVIDGTEEQRVFAYLNGQPAVKVSVQKQTEANTIEVVDGVKKKITALRQAGIIPSSAQLLPTLDDSILIRNAIANVTASGIFGATLAAISVLLFLSSLRQTFVIVLAIVLSTFTAVIAMGFTGLSLNLFSLGGLALGVGIVVDNSIVMMEQIVTHQNKDASPEEFVAQTVQSSSQVESALIASTSTNLVAVVPFLLIGGFVSLIFNELILTISYAVAASILVAITVVPALCSRLLAIPFTSGLSRWWLFRSFNDHFQRGTILYGQMLSWALGRKVLIVGVVFLFLGGSSLWMVGQISQEILPRTNTGQVNVIAQFPAGTTLAYNQRVMDLVQELVQKQPETEYAFATVGGTAFANNITANPLRSSLTITLKANGDAGVYARKLSRELNKLNLPGVRLRANPEQVRGLIVNNTPVPRTDITVLLAGENPEALNRAGREVLSALEEGVKGANFRPDTDPSEPELQIVPDWDRLENLGLTTVQIGQTIQTAVQGSVPTQLQRGSRLVNVRVQLPPRDRLSPAQVAQLPLFMQNSQGLPRLIRVADVAEVREGLAPAEIQRLNQRQVYMILGNLNPGASLSDAIAQTNQVLSQITLPPGVQILPSGEAESNRQLQNSLIVLGSLAVFMVFLVMAVQYNSLVDPLVIMFTVPLALAGGIAGLYITRTAFSIPVVAGAVLLVGIVVNNGIVMIEVANQIRIEEQMPRRLAILKAAPLRLRAILMTTITTVLGSFPLALGAGRGSEFLQPLGIVIFSGLSLATLLTLFIIPCMYVLVHEAIGWLGALGRNKQPQMVPLNPLEELPTNEGKV